MGEAKRRKLAGTYPPQDGGSWTYIGAEVLRVMPSDFRAMIDVLLDGWVGLVPVPEGEEAPSSGEKRRAVYHLVDRGFAVLGLREYADGLQLRIVPMMPPEPGAS